MGLVRHGRRCGNDVVDDDAVSLGLRRRKAHFEMVCGRVASVTRNDVDPVHAEGLMSSFTSWWRSVQTLNSICARSDCRKIALAL